MDYQVAAILEVINKYKTGLSGEISKEAKQTELPYYTSAIQAKIHEGYSLLVETTKLWTKENPDNCRVLGIYDLTIHMATSVVTIVNKNSKLYRDGNQIKGGRSFYIRSINRYMSKPYGLYRVADGLEDLILELNNKSRQEYMFSATKIKEWYINQTKEGDNKVYIHYGGFNIMQNEIDDFIGYVNSVVE